ncbi:MAG TPA: S4 domain-containing protein [Gemmatimonadaceae bacterium]|jgi:ribosome-associated heat shock protein Hsp15|nr:S4 domain-containing protein [Gemmatimonadaceae bacterium]
MSDKTRLDKWLWAARFYKTRSLAIAAIENGRVEVNGDKAKPAKALAVGDRVRVRQPPFEVILVVKALSERRGPAVEAAKLYEELPESIAARQALAAQIRTAPVPAYDREGRPTKKDRRLLDDWRGRRS